MAGFGVNGDAGKAGKKAISEKAGFTIENGFVMEAGRNVLKLVGADLNRGLSLPDGGLGQTDGGLTAAIPGLDIRSHPLQVGDAAGVQADPLGFSAVYGDGDAHPARAELEGQ